MAHWICKICYWAPPCDEDRSLQCVLMQHIRSEVSDCKSLWLAIQSQHNYIDKCICFSGYNIKKYCIKLKKNRNYNNLISCYYIVFYFCRFYFFVSVFAAVNFSISLGFYREFNFVLGNICFVSIETPLSLPWIP